jgi:membrane protease YdiL (CAAX protease family)
LVLPDAPRSQPVPESQPASQASQPASQAASEPFDPGVMPLPPPARFTVPKDKPYPWLAALLSVPCTGCGVVYLNRFDALAPYAGPSLALLAGVLGANSLQQFRPESPVPAQASSTLFTAWLNLKFYSVFDTYRQARKIRGTHKGEITPTNEPLSALLAAPFSPTVLRRPWVWAGVPAMLAGAFTASALAQRASLGAPGALSLSFQRPVAALAQGGDWAGTPAAIDGRALLRDEFFALATVVPVAIGEEALFRGVIQHRLEESLGPIGGLAAGSAIFGAAHIVNFLSRDPETGRVQVSPVAATSLPILAGLGAVIGAAYQKTEHQLTTSVAMHFWYDFALFSAVAVARSSQTQPAMFRMAFPW